MSSIMTKDEYGRAFCKEHNRDICHDCGLDFRDMNRMAEEDAGLKKKRSEVEQTAEMIAVCLYALNGMERMRPRPNEAIFENNRQRLKEYQDKLQSLKDAGEEGVDEALRKACEKQNVSEIQMRGLMQAWSKQNPGKTTMEIGGEETQKLYEQFIAPPVKTSSKPKAEKWTCDYCNKTSIKKLPMCTRCKTVSYCNRECQVAAWKAHKTTCVPIDKEPKSLPQTWAQVESHGGSHVEGKTLEVRAILDESMSRQIFQCKDRVGVVKRIAAYTNDRRIPGLQQGSVIRWKNPRFYYFMDGSSGARIEEEDLPNLKISNR
eukprot:scaffold15840_cov142-Skeletonema_marinoi.AAC.6